MANENIETTERFSKHEVAVTMLGEEWFALLCRATIGKPPSVRAQVYARAAKKMLELEQLIAASAEIAKRKIFSFDLVCPRCGNETTLTSTSDTAPNVRCGDCLMNDVEIVTLGIRSAREVVS